MKYIGPIDPHVHLRGEEYLDYDYVRMAFEDADRAGVQGLLEMPNPRPFLTSADECATRHRNIEARHLPSIHHGIHIGMTNNIHQVTNVQTLPVVREWGPHSDKIFYTNSTGDMGIIDPAMQQYIWRLKSENAYRGVSIGHFEDEALFLTKFDHKDPISHSVRQCCDAELLSVETQLRNAIGVGFRGTFYIAHCSNPETLKLVRAVRRICPFKIVVEVTWHHLFLNTDDYDTHGNRVKMNPPLRHPKVQAELLENLVKHFDIDIIATDHAPHPIEAKDSNKPPSGIPGLLFWPRGIWQLRQINVSPQRIEDLTFNNANRVFNLGLKPVEVEREYQPALWSRYGFNPYSRFE